MLDWHLCQICYSLEISYYYYYYISITCIQNVTDLDLVSVQMFKSQIFFRIPVIFHENE